MPEENTAWDHSLRDSLVRKMVSCGQFAVSWVVCTAGAVRPCPRGIRIGH